MAARKIILVERKRRIELYSVYPKFLVLIPTASVLIDIREKPSTHERLLTSPPFGIAIFCVSLVYVTPGTVAL